MQPYLEPVDGTAVDERREHSKSVAEGISNGTHGEHHVKMFLHSLDEEVVHGQRCGVNLATLWSKSELWREEKDGRERADLCSGHHLHLLNDICLLIRGVQIGHIPGVQDHVEIFNKRLVLKEISIHSSIHRVSTTDLDLVV